MDAKFPEKNMGKSTLLFCRELCCYTDVNTPPRICFQEDFLIVKVDCFTASKKTKALLKHTHFRYLWLENTALLLMVDFCSTQDKVEKKKCFTM